MPMTRYEKAKIAEFYGQAVSDILSSFLSDAEEKEKCRPGVGTPRAADDDVVPTKHTHRISHGAGNVKENGGIEL